jgi:mannose-1-phosphate guanylyltransferase
VITNAEYRFLVAEQAQEIGVALAGVLLEPVARNTLAAMAAGAVYARQKFGGDAILHVIASDAAIEAGPSYWDAVARAASAAREGRLVTFGVKPTAPETGYGYIEAGEEVAEGVNRVARFVEKPGREKAAEMLAAGSYYWNSGMFMLEADTFLGEAERLAAESVAAAREAVERSRADLDFIRLDEAAFAQAPNISVDYAVFERSDKVAMVPVSFAWSDLGSWDAVWKVSRRDADGNAVTGSATLSDTRNSLIVSEKAHVAVDGLDDVAIVASEDAVYVGKLSNAQRVSALVNTLRENPETARLTEIHKTAYRPWGGYSSILGGERFQVKRLFVKPGRRLSLQKHHHRAEHWVVVRGTAEVTRDGEIIMLAENESVYLPLGCVHRLANPGKIMLELIEVQTGSYLGEDDIVRLEDEFGRP